MSDSNPFPTPNTDRVAQMDGSWTTRAMRLEDLARQQERELVALRAILENPEAVYINLERGTIARPSTDQILRVYPNLDRRTDTRSGRVPPKD